MGEDRVDEDEVKNNIHSSFENIQISNNHCASSSILKIQSNVNCPSSSISKMQRSKFFIYLKDTIKCQTSCVFYQELKYPGEPLKTLMAMLFQVELKLPKIIFHHKTSQISFQSEHFQLAGMVTTTIALIITNEFVPDSPTDKPLPDRVGK